MGARVHFELRHLILFHLKYISKLARGITPHPPQPQSCESGQHIRRRSVLPALQGTHPRARNCFHQSCALLRARSRVFVNLLGEGTTAGLKKRSIKKVFRFYWQFACPVRFIQKQDYQIFFSNYTINSSDLLFSL